MKTYQGALIGAAIAIAISGAASAGVYKWVDKDGKVRYGDRPPPSEAATVQEVNRSAVPMALQDRLRKLDTDFKIKRINGNVNIASVCLEVHANDRDEPAFVREFATAGLGEIQKVGDVGYGHVTEYDDDGRTVSHDRKPDDRCPNRTADYAARSMFRIYQLTFNPKTVAAYRTQ